MTQSSWYSSIKKCSLNEYFRQISLKDFTTILDLFWYPSFWIVYFFYSPSIRQNLKFSYSIRKWEFYKYWPWDAWDDNMFLEYQLSWIKMKTFLKGNLYAIFQNKVIDSILKIISSEILKKVWRRSQAKGIVKNIQKIVINSKKV